MGAGERFDLRILIELLEMILVAMLGRCRCDKRKLKSYVPNQAHVKTWTNSSHRGILKKWSNRSFLPHLRRSIRFRDTIIHLDALLELSYNPLRMAVERSATLSASVSGLMKVLTLSEGGISLMNWSPMMGSFCEGD